MNSEGQTNEQPGGWYVTKENITLGLLLSLVLAVFGGGWRMGQMVTTMEAQGETNKKLTAQFERLQEQIYGIKMDLQKVSSEAVARDQYNNVIERANGGRRFDK